MRTVSTYEDRFLAIWLFVVMVVCATAFAVSGTDALPFLPVFASASNVYVTPAGMTIGGTGCTNGALPNYTPAQFNNAANWGSGATQIGPGTHILACGTFSETVGFGPLLQFQAGGTSGSPIVLTLDDSFHASAPSWGANVIDDTLYQYSGGLSYITVDGGADYQSLIEATENGSANATCTVPGTGGCMYQNGSGACWGSNTASNITVEHLTCNNLYVHYCASGDYTDATCNDNAAGTGPSCIFMQDGSNLNILNNHCHDVGWAFSVAEAYNANYSNVTIAGNTSYHACGGPYFGDNQTPGYSVTNLTVNGNNDYDGFNWAETSAGCHVDGMHLYINSGTGTVNNTLIYDNWIHGNMGNAVNGWYFMEGDSTAWVGVWVFNNLAEDDTPISHFGDGMYTIAGNNAVVVNNTSNGGDIGMDLYGYTGQVYENNTLLAPYATYVIHTGSTATIDYNNYWNFNNMDDAGANFATWKTNCACDSHSSNTNQNFSGGALPLPIALASQLATNYIPSVSSTALISTGINLTSLSIPALDFDYAGTARPSGSTPWYIGVYNSTSGTPSPPPSPLPTFTWNGSVTKSASYSTTASYSATGTSTQKLSIPFTVVESGATIASGNATRTVTVSVPVSGTVPVKGTISVPVAVVCTCTFASSTCSCTAQ